MITVNNTPVLEDFYEPAPKLDNSHRQYLDNTYGSNYIVNGQLKHRGFDWNTFDNLYNEGKKLGIPFNTMIGIMANVAIESGGYEGQRQINWNHKKGTPWTYLDSGGVGLLQFTGQAVPKNQRQYLYNSIINPYHSQSNYWLGGDTYRSGLQKGVYNLDDSIKYYRTQFVRPGKPALEKALDIGRRFSKIYQKYFKGGII